MSLRSERTRSTTTGVAAKAAPVLSLAAGALAAVAVAACGGSGAGSASTTLAATSTTGTTLLTQVVGTDPTGEKVTVTRTVLTTSTVGPNGVPLETGEPLAPPVTPNAGLITDRIQCARLDQLAYQAYSHLQVYVDGAPRSLPGGIGLVKPSPQRNETVTTYSQSLCAYWLHTTAANGIIAVRAPVRRAFDLGEFFDIWGLPLDRGEVGPAQGKVTAIVDGRPFSGNPRAIPLHEHATIELAVGSPVPRFTPLDWSTTDL